MKNKEAVKLREKKLKTGGSSLYLDIYLHGMRKFEYLKLYLIPETSRQAKEQNRNTLAIANAVKAKRLIEIQSGSYNIQMACRADTFFFAYFDKMCKQLESRQGVLWKAVRKIVQDYAGDRITFKNIDHSLVKGLREHIDHLDLKQGSKHVYFAIFKAVMNQAVKDGIIDHSPASGVNGFKPSEPKRTYLTADELRQMVQTECKNEIVKKAFLFSCLTGLRLSDIRNLTWQDVSEENGYTRITFRQQKTKWQEYLDINEQAVALMGEKGDPDASVFGLVYTYDWINKCVDAWAKSAGIEKHISFHVSRHTFATMMLGNGVDLYVVSKLVGHRDIKTTQIYAKIMDKDKQKAVDKMPKIL